MDSEFRTYTYIEGVLKKLGWDTRNPRNGGQVYTQSEFRKHDQVLTSALGRLAPENVVVIPWKEGFSYWIVEAKRSHDDLEKALGEAKAYASTVNDVKTGAARFATGVAGGPNESYYVTTAYWDGENWSEVAINNYGTTGFLRISQCLDILENNSPNILDYDIDIDAFLNKANDINVTLHKNGIAARDRARLVSGLLLALAQ